MDDPVLITIPELARRLSIGKTQAWLIARRDLPVVRIGRSTRVLRESADEWARARASVGPVETRGVPRPERTTETAETAGATTRRQPEASSQLLRASPRATDERHPDPSPGGEVKRS